MFDGVCECEDGYNGKNCETVMCPDECSGVGSCVAGVCQCPPDRSGYIYKIVLSLFTLSLSLHSFSTPSMLLTSAVSLSPLSLSLSLSLSLPCIPYPLLPAVSPFLSLSRPACDTVICPNDCNAHGACRGVIDVFCVCDEGFTGKDCAEKNCPTNCTDGHGDCNDGLCFCKIEWGGDLCQFAVCPNQVHHCFIHFSSL